MGAGIWQDVVLSIPSGWCNVGGSWHYGWLVCDSVQHDDLEALAALL